MKSKSFSLALCVTLAASLLILAGSTSCGGGSVGGIQNPPPATLSSITVTPAGMSLVVGGSQQYKATGNYSDGTTKDLSSTASWSSTSTATATIAGGGMAQAVAAGTTTIAAGSGSKSGSTQLTVTAAQQPIKVTIKPQNPTVASGGTVQFTATVSNTSNTDVMWTATKGTISASGLLTAPTGTTQTTLTVTATSVADSTKSDSTTVTVTAASSGITITSVTPPYMYIPDTKTLIVPFTLVGTGFAAGQKLHISGYADGTLPNGISSTQLAEEIEIATPFYMPRPIEISISSADGTVTSNTVEIAFVGNQNTLTLDSAGNLYHLDQAQGFPSDDQNGFVRNFKANGTANGSFNVGGNVRSIAFDDADSLISVGTGLWDVNGTFEGGGNNGVATMGTAAKNGILFGAQPDANQSFQFLISQALVNNPTFHTSAAGQQPWSVAMVTVGSELDGLSYDTEGKQLMRFRISDMTQQGIALPVSGCTPPSQLASLNGGWQLVAFSTGGPSGGKGALLCQFDKVLILFDLATMTETGRVTLTGLPFRIAADVTHGNVVLANRDVTAKVTRFSKVNASATGTITPTSLSATTPLLSVGFAISPDGTKIDACMQDQCSVFGNN